MAIQLAWLIERLPQNAEGVVELTRRRFNQSVRQILRDETRLRLSKVVDLSRREDREAHAVRVQLAAGLPEHLESVAFDDDLWLAIELAPLKGVLNFLRDAAIEMQPVLNRLEEREEFRSAYPEASSTIDAARDLAIRLLKESARVQVLEKMFAVNDDVLGIYSFSYSKLPARTRDEAPPSDVKIVLYWAVIGFVARVLGVSAEALTLTVLAHELAHTYTHLGIDADGRCWGNHAFAKSEIALKEGLAQYYTERVLNRLAIQMPAALAAYKMLLPHQPDAYRTHEGWIKNFSAEQVRDAMLVTRRGEVGALQAFNEALGRAQTRLRNAD